MDQIITADDVLRTFMTSPGARQRFETWENDPRRTEVVHRVMNHRSSVILSLSVSQLQDVCRTTEHALGEIRKSDIERVEAIRDWSGNFAVTHVFHFIVEDIGEFPTWQGFREQAQSAAFRDMLWVPAQRAVRQCMEKDRVEARLARDAMRWRIGNFYYSFLREQVVWAGLREEGLVIRQHPLADALFRIDGWIDRVIINLFIGNPRYRGQLSGRKTPSQEILRQTRPPFHAEDVELTAASRFGAVHVPAGDDIRALAERIRGRIADIERGDADARP